MPQKKKYQVSQTTKVLLVVLTHLYEVLTHSTFYLLIILAQTTKKKKIRR